MDNIHESKKEVSSLIDNQKSTNSNKIVPIINNNQKMDPNNSDTWGKVARNEPCPCGSNKKYKHCHGMLI